MKHVLFICTGNFYRSRYAEALFNHLAEQKNLEWRAFSRGLAIHWAEGDLSPYTRDALQRHGVELRHTGKTRVSLTEEDLQRADLTIVLDEREHREMVQAQFPDWEPRLTFWTCGDIHLETPQECLPRIHDLVHELVDRLAESQSS